MTIHNKIFEEPDSGKEGERGGATRQRLRREDPVRDHPLRYWSHLYRRPGSWRTPEFSTPASSGNGAQREDVHDDTVSHGVKLGYRVVEEHIRQGRRVAQQINARPSTSGGGENDIGELFGRMVRYCTDLGSLWSDLLNALAANPEFLNNLLRMVSPQPSPAANGKPTSAEPIRESIAVSVEMIANRPSQVTVDLRPQSQGCMLATAGLYAINPAAPPLLDIHFEPPAISGQVVLRIRIPDGQPPDVYTGVIVDKITNLPQGTLSVRVASS
jgi:hypothetical protein